MPIHCCPNAACASSGHGTATLWNGPLQPRVGGGYEPAPLGYAGTLHDLSDVAKEFGVDLDDHIIRGED